MEISTVVGAGLPLGIVGAADLMALIERTDTSSLRILAGISDNALNQMREAIDGGVDMDAIWREHRPGGRRPG